MRPICKEPGCYLDSLSDGNCYSHAKIKLIDNFVRDLILVPFLVLLMFGLGLGLAVLFSKLG